MIAFDKPSGLLVSPDQWDRKRPDLTSMVREALGPNVANVHRLDAETSGVVLFAKTKPALDYLSGQFQSKTVEKRYLALVVGSPENDAFVVDQPLIEDEHQRGRMRISSRHGKAAESEFRVLERFGTFTLVECRPLTGRNHQVRLHLANEGWPVLNDAVYGNETKLMLSAFKRGYKGRDDEKPLMEQLALHAGDLILKHPETKEPMTIHAELPHEFEVALKYLRKFAIRHRKK